jgi:hypothetical protein
LLPSVTSAVPAPEDKNVKMQRQTANTKQRRLIAISGLALGIGVCTIAAPSILRAQGSPAADLRGTWLVSVTRSDGVVLQSLVTFLEGGAVLQDANSTAGQGLGVLFPEAGAALDTETSGRGRCARRWHATIRLPTAAEERNGSAAGGRSSACSPRLHRLMRSELE